MAVQSIIINAYGPQLGIGPQVNSSCTKKINLLMVQVSRSHLFLCEQGDQFSWQKVWQLSWGLMQDACLLVRSQIPYHKLMRFLDTFINRTPPLSRHLPFGSKLLTSLESTHAKRRANQGNCASFIKNVYLCRFSFPWCSVLYLGSVHCKLEASFLPLYCYILCCDADFAERGHTNLPKCET